MTEKNTFNNNFLRTVGLIAVATGAIGSLYFMFNAARNQNSILLIALFTAWVFSPFAGLFFANKIVNSRTGYARASLYRLMIIVTIISLFAYSGILVPPKSKLTFMFLVVPLLSWISILITILVTRKLSRKNE